MSERRFRILPAVTEENEHFWHGGARGELCFSSCSGCGHYIHPPAPICPSCLGRRLEVKPVSGRATVVTLTINHHPWIPGFDPPYVVAIVELDEQAGLRLTTNIVGCPPDAVTIGMRVQVVFEEAGDGVFLPLFAPVAPTAAAASNEG